MTSVKYQAEKPPKFVVQKDNIPQALRDIPHWAFWAWEKNKDGTKWTKPCTNAKGRRIPNDNKTLWGPFEEAYQTFTESTKIDGLAFTMGKGVGFVVVDLDNCRNPKTGVVEKWADDVVDLFDSYTELSPSGEGMKIWIRGKLPDGSWKTTSACARYEVFARKKYVTVTGQVYKEQHTGRRAETELLGFMVEHMQNDQEVATLSSGEVDLVVVQQALNCIDPDEDYDTWIRIGMALHSVDQFALWDEWSKKGSKYEGQSSLKAHWQSFRAGQISIGTLFYYAKQDGFVMPKKGEQARAELTDGYYLTWENGDRKGTSAIRCHDAMGDIIHCDILNPTRAKLRKDFAKAITAVDDKVTEAALLKVKPLKVQEQTEKAGDEIDIGQTVRPERIITSMTSAIMVGIPLEDDEGNMYTRPTLYATDGEQRTAMSLGHKVEVFGESTLVHPVPYQCVVAQPPWSKASRDSWLASSHKIDVQAIYSKLCEAFDHYCEFQDRDVVDMLACWVTATYAYHVYPAFGYLMLNGVTNTGKSTVFDILGEICFRPVKSDNTTAACLFRTLDSSGGTLLYDEAEQLRNNQSDNVKELMSILLSGYKQGGRATRLEKVEDQWLPREYSVYGPKAMACINGAPPQLQNRCITVTTIRAAKDSPKPKRRLEDMDWQGLRDDMYVMALEKGRQWADIAAKGQYGEDINGREFQVWQPVLAMAQFFESEGVTGLVAKMDAFAGRIRERTEELKTSPEDEVLLRVLADHYYGPEETNDAGEPMQRNPLRSSDILETAKCRSSTFEKWKPESVGLRLRNYGLISVRIDGRRVYNPTEEELLNIEMTYAIDIGMAQNLMTG